MPITNYLLEQLHLHSNMQSEDVIKLCYQAAYGAEHLLSDISGAKRYFEEEYRNVEGKNENLYEEISDKVVRVNLGAWKANGLSKDDLFDMFVQSSSIQEDGAEQLKEYLNEANSLIRESEIIPFRDEWKKILKAYQKSGMPAMHHSHIYHQNEKPSYRIVKKSILMNYLENRKENIEFQTEIFSQFNKEWALLSAGNKDHYNSMTISWGEMGTLWNKPVITVYVKPCRYTYQFMDENEYYTVSFYPEQYHKDLSVMGMLSGRDGDKVGKTSLTLRPLSNGITYQQASVTFVCKKIYYNDLDINQIPSWSIERNYQKEPVHRMYVGEVVEIIR